MGETKGQKMTEQDLKNLILEKYSKDIADYLAKEGFSGYFPGAGDWDKYCNSIKTLVAQDLPEKEFVDQAFVMPLKCGMILYDD